MHAFCQFQVKIQKTVGHHPFIVNIVEFWQGRKSLFIVTDFISCGELHTFVTDHNNANGLPEDVARIYIAEMALAIDFLRNAGIIHRDLKATNILLDCDGHAVLTDFGFAKWLRPTDKTRTICGTPEYMGK